MEDGFDSTLPRAVIRNEVEGGLIDAEIPI